MSDKDEKALTDRAAKVKHLAELREEVAKLEAEGVTDYVPKEYPKYIADLGITVENEKQEDAARAGLDKDGKHVHDLGVADGTVAEAEALIARATTVKELKAIQKAEDKRDGGARIGVQAAIDRRLTELG